MRDIFVYIDTGEPTLMGVLHSEVIRGKEVFSYENDSGWLRHPQFRALDPDLSAFTGVYNNQKPYRIIIKKCTGYWLIIEICKHS